MSSRFLTNNKPKKLDSDQYNMMLIFGFGVTCSGLIGHHIHALAIKNTSVDLKQLEPFFYTVLCKTTCLCWLTNIFVFSATNFAHDNVIK